MNSNYELIKDNIIYMNQDWDSYEIVDLSEMPNPNDLRDYCTKRKAYVSKHLKTNIENDFQLVIPNVIESKLANLHQLTFEVTDMCNLKCKYCAFGELYGDYDERANNLLKISDVKLLLDYLIDLWNSDLNKSHGSGIYISFYGGEPLVNFNFIEETVEYIASKNLYHNHIIFSMTTNAVLLKKHIQYLVNNNFRLLVSLDGDKKNNSYRIFQDGSESFSLIINNLDYVRDKYPLFFENNINFNSVLHDMNSVEETFNYIRNRFNKFTRISELNPSGLKKNQISTFNKMYKSQRKSLLESKNAEYIKKKMSANLAEVMNLFIFLSRYSGNIYQDYNELLLNDEYELFETPSGTCYPFSKKMYVTVTGKILPCEKISHRFALGHVDSNCLSLDFDGISKMYNNYYNSLISKCKMCSNLKTCTLCIFNLDTIDSNPLICPRFKNKKNLGIDLNNHIKYLSNNVSMYRKLVNEIVLQID